MLAWKPRLPALTQLERLEQRLIAPTAAPGQSAPPLPGSTAPELMRRAGLEPEPWQVGIAEATGNCLILCHRQRGKSTMVAAEGLSVATQQAGALVLIVAPSQKQSQEDLRKVKLFYRHAGLPPLVRDSEMSIELPNGSRIIALPGNPETIVGYSAVDLLILDEAARIRDMVYHSLRPMLLMSQGRLLALSTPFGQRGWYYEAWEADQYDQRTLDKHLVAETLRDLGWTLPDIPEAPDRPYGWQRIKVTVADKTPRLSPYFLAQERRSLPDLVWRQEYQCEFVEQLGAVFRHEDIQGLLSPDVLPLFAADSAEHEEVDQLLSRRVTPLFAEVE